MLIIDRYLWHIKTGNCEGGEDEDAFFCLYVCVIEQHANEISWRVLI